MTAVRLRVAAWALLLDACTPLVGSPDAAPGGAPCVGRSSERGGVVEGDPARGVPSTPEVGLHAMGLDRAGNVYLLGAWVLSDHGDEEALVQRLRRDGTVDRGFGEGGVARVRPAGGPGYTEFLAMDEDAAGRLLFAGSVCREVPGSRAVACRALVARLLADGRADAGFGRGGQREFGLAAGGGDGPMAAYDVAADGDRVVVAGSDENQYTPTTAGFVLRLRGDGSLDPDFNGGGVRFDGAASSIVAVEVTARGYVAAGTARAGGAPRLAAFTREARPDVAFGEQGAVDLAAAGPVDVRALVAVPGGGFALAGPVATDRTRTVVARVDGRGAPVASFGGAGHVTLVGAPWAEFYTHGSALAAQCDGRLALTTWDNPSPPRVRRLLADGAVDRGFGDAGSVGLSAGTFPLGVAVDPADGALVAVAAPWEENAAASVWRLRP